MSTIPQVDDPTHGAVHWWSGHGPAPVEPFTGHCDHWGQAVIAYGWDLKHYELVECGLEGDGTNGCRSRAWTNDKGQTTTPWMQPKEPARV